MRMRYTTWSAEGTMRAVGSTREGETIDGLVARLRKLDKRGISVMPPFIILGGVLYGPEVTGR